jgi:hypothetical protein
MRASHRQCLAGLQSGKRGHDCAEKWCRCAGIEGAPVVALGPRGSRAIACAASPGRRTCVPGTRCGSSQEALLPGPARRLSLGIVHRARGLQRVCRENGVRGHAAHRRATGCGWQSAAHSAGRTRVVRLASLSYVAATGIVAFFIQGITEIARSPAGSFYCLRRLPSP